MANGNLTQHVHMALACALIRFSQSSVRPDLLVDSRPYRAQVMFSLFFNGVYIYIYMIILSVVISLISKENIEWEHRWPTLRTQYALDMREWRKNKSWRLLWSQWSISHLKPFFVSWTKSPQYVREFKLNSETKYFTFFVFQCTQLLLWMPMHILYAVPLTVL